MLFLRKSLALVLLCSLLITTLPASGTPLKSYKRFSGSCGTAAPGCAQQLGSINYTYDKVANRKTLTSTVPAIPTAITTVDSDDRLSTEGYDANGNTTVHAGTQNVYDFENKLVKYGNITFVYDGDGNRVQKTVGSHTTVYTVSEVNTTGIPQVMF